ncbi:MAG: diguanylate cyclase [Deltaproteobacteria bacterium]|nr:diguanylate cyclase [Deltaproteobacteria bacterium]
MFNPPDGIDYAQIVVTLSQGIIVIDREMRILLWNYWMEAHSRLTREDVLGKKIGDLFPDLEQKGFFWKVRSVFTLGNFAFFSQGLHNYIFPLAATRYLETSFDKMQQNVILAPLRNPDGQVEYICVSIKDDTDAAIYKERLEQSKQKLEIMSRTDPLTGLVNRRYLFERLQEEVSRHKRSGNPLSLAILDIDFFKHVNDTYGHICGDKVLIQFSELLQNQVRRYDLVGRYGGEEFCVILPGAPLAGAEKVMNRFRGYVEKTPCLWEEQKIYVTVSAGVASSENLPDLDLDSLLRLADEALLEAKGNGRNQVRTWPLEFKTDPVIPLGANGLDVMPDDGAGMESTLV